MNALRITPTRRVYILERRCHHGMIGALLAVLGSALAWHDRHDAPWTGDR